MKKTDCNFDFLSSFISSESSLRSLAGMIQDMDLEVIDVTVA